MAKPGGKQVKTGMSKSAHKDAKRVTSERNKIPSPTVSKGQIPAPTKSSYTPRFVKPSGKGRG